MSYQALLTLHIISSTLLFGTGLGTAFHGWMSHRTRDPRVVAAVGRSVVLADWLFTAPAVVVQPATGFALARLGGVPLTAGWLPVALALYVLVGACWLPVVWLQIRMHRMAADAARAGRPLPPRFFAFARLWFALGWPAFAGVLVIFGLMVFQPAL